MIFSDNQNYYINYLSFFTFQKCATHQIEEDQSEDCLTVNIWVPKEILLGKIWKDQVPIVYYIHGGGFNHGSNQADFFELVKRDWFGMMR